MPLSLAPRPLPIVYPIFCIIASPTFPTPLLIGLVVDVEAATKLVTPPKGLSGAGEAFMPPPPAAPVLPPPNKGLGASGDALPKRGEKQAKSALCEPQHQPTRLAAVPKSARGDLARTLTDRLRRAARPAQGTGIASDH